MSEPTNNQQAWQCLDKALFVSSKVSDADRESGETDWENVYPTSAEEANNMERLVDEAERCAENPNDPDLRDRINRLREIVSWSRSHHRTWTWKPIFGAIIAVGIMWYFNKDNKEDEQKASANVAMIEAWSEQDTTVTYSELPQNPDYSSRYASANNWKVYRLAETKNDIEGSSKMADGYRQQADTCTQAEKKKFFLEKASEYENKKEEKQQLYKKLADMKFADVKADALEVAGSSLEYRKGKSNKTFFWMIFMIVMIPLYILTGYQRGYSLAAHQRRHDFLDKVQDIGFIIASFFFGTGLALSFLPDYIVETRWSNGRREQHTETNPGNILMFALKGGLMIVGVFIFSFFSIFLITIHVVYGVLGYIRERKSHGATAAVN